MKNVPAPLADKGEILVQTHASLISAGTERMVVKFAKKNLISKNLRSEFCDINFYNTDSSASLTSQLKHAVKINDKFAIIITDDNIKNKNLTIKVSENQMTDVLISLEDLIKYMRSKYE